MLNSLNWVDVLVIFAASLMTAMLLLLFRRAIPSHRGQPCLQDQIGPTQSFEFTVDGTLVQHNEAAGRYLRALKPQITDWAGFRSTFLRRFDDLPGSISISDVARTVQARAKSPAEPMMMELERHQGGMTVLLYPRRDVLLTDPATLHRTLSSFENIDLIRTASENAPFPIWQSLPSGAIGWTNARYRTLEAQIERPNLIAGTPLFALPENTAPAKKPVRISIKDEGRNKLYWFDVSQIELDHGTLNFAIDIHAMVNAEAAQRNFVQTLAKTFAHLSTGLAIFDRNRQLVLFNPALIDLTRLPPDFLSARPVLFSFFDHLRDKHIMPEPKDYSSWRERIADVVTDASNDNFNETWHLSNGLTYRVTGRPHPDGAIAFLFEDISAEISLTRRFRSESAITQSALDAMDEGVAIFNEAGFLIAANSVMRRHLGVGPADTLDNKTVQAVSGLWQRSFKPSPIWGEIREFASGLSERAAWSSRVMSKTGAIYLVQVSPLTAGATMVRMVPRETADNAKPAKRRSDAAA